MAMSFIIKSVVLCAWTSLNTLLNGRKTNIIQFVNFAIGVYLLYICFSNYGFLYAAIWFFAMWEGLGIFRRMFLALGMKDYHPPEYEEIVKEQNQQMEEEPTKQAQTSIASTEHDVINKDVAQPKREASQHQEQTQWTYVGKFFTSDIIDELLVNRLEKVNPIVEYLDFSHYSYYDVYYKHNHNSDSLDADMDIISYSAYFEFAMIPVLSKMQLLRKQKPEDYYNWLRERAEFEALNETELTKEDVIDADYRDDSPELRQKIKAYKIAVEYHQAKILNEEIKKSEINKDIEWIYCYARISNAGSFSFYPISANVVYKNKQTARFACKKSERVFGESAAEIVFNLSGPHPNCPWIEIKCAKRY